MKPKEKAKEIYCKYTNALNIRDLQTTANPFAKQCALIAVDEVILSQGTGCYECGGGDQQFWETVKNEIEQL